MENSTCIEGKMRVNQIGQGTRISFGSEAADYINKGIQTGTPLHELNTDEFIKRLPKGRLDFPDTYTAVIIAGDINIAIDWANKKIEKIQQQPGDKSDKEIKTHKNDITIYEKKLDNLETALVQHGCISKVGGISIRKNPKNIEENPEFISASSTETSPSSTITKPMFNDEDPTLQRPEDLC
jgi:hypothetical protein